MKLLNSYFNIIESTVTEDGLTGKFIVSLNGNHPVYEGHFPGEPVCPGVCSMQMVKECAAQMCGKKLTFIYLKQYRLLSVMTPAVNGNIDINIELTPAEKDGTSIFKIKAAVCESDNIEQKYLDINGELAPAE